MTLPKRLPSPWWCVGVGKTLAAPCLKASRFRFPLPREARRFNGESANIASCRAFIAPFRFFALPLALFFRPRQRPKSF